MATANHLKPPKVLVKKADACEALQEFSPTRKFRNYWPEIRGGQTGSEPALKSASSADGGLT